MKSFTKLLPLLALAGLLLGCKDHDLGNNVIEQNGLSLSPAQETILVNSAATGSAEVSYDKNTKKLSYTVTFNNLSGIPTAGHIHGSSPRGANSGVLFPFTGIPNATSGVVIGSATLTMAQEQDLLNGLFYFNFHTAAYPSGELRGQIEFYDQSFIVSKKALPLSGAQEVPAKSVAASGSGDVSYNKNTKTLSYFVTFTNMSSAPSMGHIHGSAPRGANAGVLFPFAVIPPSTSGAVSGSAVLTATQEADLLNGLFYFNLHTAANPGGEIRGQIEF
ncbi:CHRD domain-containing protein [Persicitalea jodogahamensis]|uniref:CHRD domain-containing protein n=1 Tax=Persicitalea jodogahamensis TaxID=402147 RepID=A0A8J3D497_9BACT|nr:CHRD domain-containing protein [Persicitalea jodogahamensis]GHB80756.1 hypothetical protein GCM10007390_39090 [Persicitalea jodogahamensis]